jgi:hypothetical protein
MNETVRRFLFKKHVSHDINLNPYVESAIEIIQLTDEEVARLIDLHHDSSKHQPAFEVLHDMYQKCQEFTSGALSAFLISHIGSAEALCRTAIESAVNLHYVSLGDDLANILAYFKNYLTTERKQNRQWLKSVEESNNSSDDKQYHIRLIVEKDNTLDHYEDALRSSLSIIHVDYNMYNDSWPSIFDRFVKIGKEIDYRTIYVALCSQAHNDPEDVLNSLMSRIIPVEGYADSVEIERYNFSLNMVIASISFYIEATAMFLAKYDISVTDTILPLWSRAMELVNENISVSEQKIFDTIKNKYKK